MEKYRISEYKIKDEKGNSFFVEVGKPYKEKLFWCFYVTKINWIVDSGFNNFQHCVERISELKLSIPVYHDIK